MSKYNREINSFFYSQYFSDGLRIAIGILLPALICQYIFNRFDVGINLSLGAVCICGIDSPGPLRYKFNAMAVGNLCILLVAITTGFARLNRYTMGVEITVFSFIFSMLIVYGNRAASVGTSALLVMVLLMAKAVAPHDVLKYSLTVTAGSVWYMLFSMVFFGIRPYRAAQQALGENITHLVKFLRIKADFYRPEVDIDDNYRKLVSEQVQVSQQQDLARELLFKSRLLVKESTVGSRILILTFVDLVDMFEHIMANHYDYVFIRKQFQDTGILEIIVSLLDNMAKELDNIGYAILSNRRHNSAPDFNRGLEDLKLKIDQTGAQQSGISNIILKKILINLRDLGNEIANIFNYYNSRSSQVLIPKNEGDIERSRFVTSQDYAPHIFFDNLSWDSSSFKHALRVSLVCLVGYLISKFISQGHHSYWILLTIIVILKPGFSLSRQRNFQRLGGTILGGFAGVLIIYLLPDTKAEFFIMVALMIGTYSFLRVNYIVSVLFMTPYILILFRFLGLGGLDIVEERITDTLIGSGVALAATYLLFPSWEFEQIKENVRFTLSANLNYLVKVAENLSDKQVSTTDYKLARKDVYVKSANLSAMFERMTSEPKKRQKKIREIHRFVVLNHILSSYIATVAGTIAGKQVQQIPADNIKSIRKSIATLNDSNKKLGGLPVEATIENKDQGADAADLSPDEVLLKDQLGFINKLSIDIARVTDTLLQ